MKLTWRRYSDVLFGHAFSLEGLPKGDCGKAHKHDRHHYIAHASIGSAYLSHRARTVHGAIKRLNAEIDRRSIGLLGVDDLVIECEE